MKALATTVALFSIATAGAWHEPRPKPESGIQADYFELRPMRRQDLPKCDGFHPSQSVGRFYAVLSEPDMPVGDFVRIYFCNGGRWEQVEVVP